MLKNEDGFTLLEMLIVLMVISILIILIVPTISDSRETINEKGCDALVAVVQTQFDLFYLEENSYPDTIDDLVDKGYINDSQKTCPDSGELEIVDRTVQVNNGT